jgi:hypothetical protein
MPSHDNVFIANLFIYPRNIFNAQREVKMLKHSGYDYKKNTIYISA